MLQSVAALVVVAACRARPVHGTLSQTDDGARDEGLLETFGRAPGEPPGRFWARHAAYEGRRADAAEAATHEARKLFAERLSGLETDLTQTIERAYQARVAAAARDRDAALEVVYAKAHGEFLAAMRYREEALAALHGRVDTEFDEAFDPTSYASAFNADEVRAARGAAGDDDAVIDDDDAAQPSLRPTTPAFDELATKYPTPSRTCFWRRVDGAREFRACGDATPFLRVADLDMYGDVAYLGLCEDAVSRRGCLAIARCSTVEWREVVEWTPDLCGIDDEVPETPSERPCYWEFAAGERTDSGALTYYGCPRTPLATFPRGHAPLDDEDEHYSRHVLPSATFFGPCAGAISLAECFTAARCWKEEARPWRNDIRGGRKSCDPVPPPSGSEIDNVYATSSAAAKPATTCFRGVPRYGVAYYFACGLFEPLARVSVVDYKVGDRVDDGVVHEVETSFTGPCADVATLDDCLVEAGCSKIAPPWTDARLCEGASMHATDFLSVYAKDLATAWSKVYSVIGDNDDKPPPEDGCPELRPLDEDECPDYDKGELVWYFECDNKALKLNDMCKSNGGECGTSKSLKNCYYKNKWSDLYIVTKPAEGGDDDAPATDDDAKPATTCYWRSSTNEFDDDATDYYACGLSEPFASVSIVSADDGVVHEVGSSFQGPCAAITPLNNCLVAVGCSQDASMLPEWTPGLCGGASVHAIDLATA